MTKTERNATCAEVSSTASMSKSQENPTRAEIVDCLKKSFPKFNKVSLCMCLNSAYGVCLSKDAMQVLQNTYPNIKSAYRAFNSGKIKSEKRVKQKRLSVRVDDDTYNRVLEKMKEDGFDSMQDYLTKLLEEK